MEMRKIIEQGYNKKELATKLESSVQLISEDKSNNSTNLTINK